MPEPRIDRLGRVNLGRKRSDATERFFAKVNRTDGCWLWTAAVSKDGYGEFKNAGRDNGKSKAHRYAYELLVGPVPEGLVLDHLCRNRRCVNPDHLEPVTHRENILRGEGIAPRNAQKVACPAGHSYDAENTVVTKRGARECRTCNRERSRRNRSERRTA